MFTPVFSAAHASQFNNLTGREKLKVAEPNWRRVYGSRENDKLQWGYYLELIPPLVPTTLDNSQLPPPPDVDSDSDAKKHVTNAQQNMSIKTHTWISLWFLLTVPVVFWDVGYCFMRPRSMVGGDLHWLWKPYEIYQEVDYVYGVKAFQEGDGFTNAQSLLNVIETLMNIAYLYLAHVVVWPSATLVGFASAVMTLSKTVLYWAQEYYCGGCAIGHNSAKDLLVYWIIPNGLWIVVPLLIVAQFGKDLSASLYVAAKSSKKATSGKVK